MKNIFNEVESNVQSYARLFSCVFSHAEGDFIWDNEGNKYLDFLSGAGSLNYGHNHSVLKKALLHYIENNGITHSLDLHTTAKSDFLQAFNENILIPRGLKYKVQFTGPTGTNAVEAALKIARNVTGRRNIIAFTNGFHGVTLGSLAVTSNPYYRNAAGTDLPEVNHMPYDGSLGDAVDTADYLDKLLSDPNNNISLPAAIIVEVVQGEGGCNAASMGWLRKLQSICKKHQMLLIVDDIQAGCGRTGDFFSFEIAGIKPDIVPLSKSISGYGSPMALVLMKEELDQWKPGEHNGTFRGNNLAFVTATAAIKHYWSSNAFSIEIKRKGDYIETRLNEFVNAYSAAAISSKGRGMFRGLDCGSEIVAKTIVKEAFKQRLIIETCGPKNEVVKVFCPLTISDENLKKGMDILELVIKTIDAETENSIHKTDHKLITN